MSSRAELEELYKELAFRASARGEAWWCNNFVSIKTPGRGKQLFTLRPAQVDGLAHWNGNRYSLTLKARQIGWSTLVAAHVLHSAFFFPDREILLISRGEREAADLLAKVKYAYRNLPEWMLARGPKLLTDHQQRMPFDNNSLIQSLPSASDPARGSSAWLIVVDEWAFLPNAEEAWASIEPVADVGGRIIGLSTANGSGNFFHELWIGAETGNNNFKAMFMPWSAGDRDAAWYEEKQRALNTWQLAQEFPSNSEDAFIKSGRPYFDLDAVQVHAVRCRLPETGHLVQAVA